MDTLDYFGLIQDAFSKLDKLQRDRETIEAEVMKLEQFITATANMLPDDAKEAILRRMAIGQELFRMRDVGLTEAVRAILRQADGAWLTVSNVRDRMINLGFDFSNYSTNPLASVSTVLRRMKPEEVDTSTVEGSVLAYRWKGMDETKDLAAMRKALAMKVKVIREQRERGSGTTAPDAIEDALKGLLKK